MARLVEEIILKVGVDTASVNAKLAGLDKNIAKTQKKFEGLTGATQDNTNEQKKSIPVARKTGVAMNDLDKKLDKTEDGWNSLTKALKKYKKESKGANKGSNSMASGLTGLAVAAGGLVGLGAVTSRLEELTTAGLDAKRLGIATQELLNLQGVAQQFGATSEDMVQGLKNINEWASLALLDGRGPKFDAFKELNIDLESFNQLNPSKQLEVFAIAIEGVENQGDKTRLQLELMQEEGSKLANTMSELATNADAAKAKVQGFTGAMDPERIEKLNDRVKELKLRFDGLLNGVINMAGAAAEGVDSVVFAFYGLNKAQEDIDDRLREIQEEAKKSYDARNKAASEKKKQDKEDIKNQEILNKLRKEAMEELNDPKRLKSIEESPQILAKKKKERDAVIDAQAKEIIRKRKEEERALKEQQKSKKNAIKTIEDIGLKRKKEYLKRLQEESKRGGTSIVEAGSVEEAEINASLENRDPDKLSKIEGLQKSIDQEEKAREAKKLKVAEETLEAIKKIEKKKPNGIRASSLS